jgi:hypothetical protein
LFLIAGAVSVAFAVSSKARMSSCSAVLMSMAALTAGRAAGSTSATRVPQYF